MTETTKLTGAALVAEYNRIATILGEPTVSRFSMLAKGQKRLAQIQERLAAVQETLGTVAEYGTAPADSHAAFNAENLEKMLEPLTGESGIPNFLRREQPAAVAVVEVVAVVPATPAAELDAAVPPTLAEQGVSEIAATHGEVTAAFVAAAEAAPVNQPAPVKKRGGSRPGSQWGLETMVEQMARYNGLADEAIALGLKFRRLGGPQGKSTFANRGDGDRAIAKVTAAIAEAKAKVTEPAS